MKRVTIPVRVALPLLSVRFRLPRVDDASPSLVVTDHAALNAGTETCMHKSWYHAYWSTSLFRYWAGPPGGVLGGGQNATITSAYSHYFSPGGYSLVIEDN